MGKKLLFLVNVDWFFISHRLPIALKAASKGFDVHVGCSCTDSVKTLTDAGITVHPINLSRSGSGLMGEAKSIIEIFRLVGAVKPDILHAITIKPVLYGGIISRILGVKFVVCSISGLGYTFISGSKKARFLRFFVEALYRVALKRAKAIIFQNSDDLEKLKRLKAVNDSQAVMVRGSGVDLSDYSPSPENTSKVVVMLVSRLLIDKGVVEFVDAAKSIAAKGVDARMILVGDVDSGNPNSVSASQLRSWIERGIVEHWGYCSDMPSIMSQANIIVLPSYREGLPKVLIEAAASRRAVITTDVPGCRDAIEPGRSGLLVPARKVEPLTEAICRLIEDPQLRFKLAKRGRELAEEAFDIKDVVAKHISIYSGEA